MELPTWRMMAISIIVAFGSNFSFGYAFILNPAEDIFKIFLKAAYYREYGTELSDVTFSAMWSMVFALPMAGALCGLFILPFLAEKLGRKWTIILNNVPVVVSCLLMLVSRQYLLFELFFVGHLFWGVCMGISGSIVGLFITECSPPQFRGMLASIQEFSVCVICTLSIILGTPAFLGRTEYMDIILTLPIFPAVLQTLLLLKVPESPKYLLITKGDEEGAMRSIDFYHGPKAAKEIIKAEFIRERNLQEKSKMTVRQCMKDPQIRMGILIGMAAGFAQMISGISVYYAFSTDMAAKAGVSSTVAKYSTVIMTSLNTLSMIPSMILVDRVGRRPLLLISLCLCCVGNMAYFTFAEIGEHLDSTWPAYIACGAIIFHSIVFTIGAGPIPWFITSEMVPQAARSTAQSLAIGANFMTQLVDLLGFYPLFYVIGPYSLLCMHIVPSIFVIIVLYKYMPETKGRLPEAASGTA